MATITNSQLKLTTDSERRTVLCKVTSQIKFTEFELCLMRTCKGQLFKLTCELWGKDVFPPPNLYSPLRIEEWPPTGMLYRYPIAKYFPDGSPSITENVEFKETLGFSILNEDEGIDEIQGKLRLLNMFTGVERIKYTDWFSYEFG